LVLLEEYIMMHGPLNVKNKPNFYPGIISVALQFSATYRNKT